MYFDKSSYLESSYNSFAGFGLNSHFPAPSIGLWKEEIQRLMYCEMNSPQSMRLDSVIIGSDNGGSEVVLTLAKKGLGRILSVDIKFNNYYPLIIKRIDRAFPEQEIIKLEMDSSKFAEWYSENCLDGKIGLAFIDGYHSYTKCLDDFNQVRPYLISGSIVCFHDCSPNFPKSGHKITDGYVSEYEDFLIDEAISTILEENQDFQEYKIPIGNECYHPLETNLTGWVRGKTSPKNSLFAIIKT